MAYFGADVARYQNPFALPWREWVAGGLEIGIVQITHGIGPEPVAEEHLQAMQAAGVPCIGAYHYQMPGNAALQLLSFFQHLARAYQFCALDVEEPGVTAIDVLAWCKLYDADCHLPLVLYGNYSVLAFIIEQHPELKRYGVWWANYPANKARIATPPPGTHASAPAGLRLAGWQFTGTGLLAPYADDIDLTEWYEIPGVPMPSTDLTGCLIGAGAESDSDIIPVYSALAAAGAVPPIIIGVQNPGLCVDAKKLGVRTTIARFMHPEVGDDHDFEAGGSGRGGWSQEKRLRFARASIALAFDNMNPAEAQVTDFVQCSGNEWDAQDVGEWLATCDVWSLVLDERDNRQAEYIRKNGKPLKLALGIFNAGTPKTWAMYVAIFSHPVFGRAHEAGDFLGFHEGVAFGQPKDYLHNVPLPDAPIIPDSGLVNFRSDYALHVLAWHGWEMPYGYLEEYDGFTRDDPDDPRIDYLQWLDRHMGTMGPKTRRNFRGACAFELTKNPKSSWYRQDFTHVLEDQNWIAYAVAQIGRSNAHEGDISMDETIRQDLLSKARVARGAVQTVIDALDAQAPAAYAWHVGDVAVAVANPLQLYDAAHNASGKPRPDYSSDQNVLAVSPDGQWLKVFASPEYWVRSADVKLKGT